MAANGNRRNAVRFELQGDLEMDRLQFSRIIVQRELGFSPSQLDYVFALPGKKTFEVIFITFALFESCFERFQQKKKDNTYLQRILIIPLSQRESKSVTVIMYTEKVSTEDIQTWLRFHCLVLRGMDWRDEDGVKTGARRFFVNLKVEDGVIKHLPSIIQLGPHRGHVFYPGQPKECRKCGSLDHLAATCTEIFCKNCKTGSHSTKDCDKPLKCNLCGATTHSFRACPFSYANKAREQRPFRPVSVLDASPLQVASHPREQEEKDLHQQRESTPPTDQERRHKQGEPPPPTDQDGLRQQGEPAPPIVQEGLHQQGEPLSAMDQEGMFQQGKPVPAGDQERLYQQGELVPSIVQGELLQQGESVPLLDNQPLEDEDLQPGQLSKTDWSKVSTPNVEEVEGNGKTSTPDQTPSLRGSLPDWQGLDQQKEDLAIGENITLAQDSLEALMREPLLALSESLPMADRELLMGNILLDAANDNPYSLPLLADSSPELVSMQSRRRRRVSDGSRGSGTDTESRPWPAPLSTSAPFLDLEGLDAFSSATQMKGAAEVKEIDREGKARKKKKKKKDPVSPCK